MKVDERSLLAAMANGSVMPRDAGVEFGIHPNRVAYICEKWASKGWYEYGVSVDLGWLTSEGKAVAMEESEK